MKRAAPALVISTAPFAHDSATTPRIMREVLYMALLVLVASCYFFGIGALLEVLAATAGSVLTEFVFSLKKRPVTLLDWTAVLTGVLLGLTLPPSLPLWMAFLGGAAGIGLGKLIFGGLGQNLFNPALVGRAFLMASFPTAMMTWAEPVEPGQFMELPEAQLAAPLMKAEVDTISAATPLGKAKIAQALELPPSPVEVPEIVVRVVADPLPLATGDTSGSTGETPAILLVFIGIWMAARRVFDWRLPVSTLLSVAVFSGILYAVNPAEFNPPLFMVLSGGLMFAAVFMVTDPVTTPTTPKGAWIFGIGVGVLVVLIREFGGLPEGVMYAILVMNAFTPHINKYTQPRPLGG